MGWSCDLSRLGIPRADPLLPGTVDPSNPEPGTGRSRGTLMSFPRFFLDISWLEICVERWKRIARTQSPGKLGKHIVHFQLHLGSSRSLSGCPRLFFRFFYRVRPKQQHRNHPPILQPLLSHPIFCLLPTFPDFYCPANGEPGIAACRQRTALKAEQDISPTAP